MSTPIDCPSCSARLRLPEECLGKRVRCPRCRDQFVAELPDEPVSDFDVVEDDEPEARKERARPERPASAALGPARKKKRKKKKDDDRLPWLIGGTVAGGLVIVGLLVWLLISVTTGGPLGPVPDDWKAFEVAGRLRCKMPGVPRAVSQNAAGVSITMNSYSPDSDSFFMVGWSDGVLPPHRRALPTETVLDDCCQGALANVKGASEESRTSVTLNGQPGKKMVVWVPQGRGRAIACTYIHQGSGRLYMAVVGGRGFREDSKQVRWFLESLEILEGMPEPKDGTPVPKDGTPVPKDTTSKVEPPGPAEKQPPPTVRKRGPGGPVAGPPQ